MEGKLKISSIQQVGIVVSDVEKTAERYWNEFGIGPWQIITFGPGMRKTTYHGEPCEFALRIAMAQVGGLILELLQPLYGPTPHQEFLDQHGDGLQHVGVFVEDLDKAAEQMKSLGYREISAAVGIGPDDNSGGIYFDTQKELGTLLELIVMPSTLPPVEKIIPSPDK